MPTYGYRCESCGVEFERFQAMSADPIRRCPTCGGRVKRLLSAGAGVIFRGEGWASNERRDRDARFSVSSATPNEQVGVDPSRGKVRAGERSGTGRRGGRGPGNAKYVQGI